MDRSIGRLVSILHRQSQIFINHALKDFKITSSEHAFLFYLYHNDGITQEDLSSYLYIDKSATARAIKSLELKDYVTRNKDLEDKRVNRVYLTDKAKKNIPIIKERVLQWSQFLTEDLDEKTSDFIFSTLEDMVNKVKCSDFKDITEET